MFFAAEWSHHIQHHLFTHFFKALLFLGVGSVIHAFKDEDITKMVEFENSLYNGLNADRNISFNWLFYPVYQKMR